MLGNVWEWVEDCDSDSYNAERDCSRRVARGGSWFNLPRYVRSASRGWDDPLIRHGTVGFRVARTLP